MIQTAYLRKDRTRMARPGAEGPAPGDGSEMWDRLFAAAKECFDRYGIEKTAMEDIAKVAGVSRGTVYRYLGDRSDLITAVVMERARVLFDQAHEVIDRQSAFADKVVEGVLYLVGQAREDKYLRFLVSSENSYLAVSTKTLDLNEEMWVPVLKEARKEGILRPDIEFLDACVWFSQVQFIMLARADKLPNDEDELRRLLQLFLLPTLVPDELLTRP